MTNKLFINMNSSLISDLAYQAEQSNLLQKVAAVVVKNNKRLGNIRHNTERNMIGRCHVPSAHAEHLALVDYFSNQEVCSRLGGWCFEKRKKAKGKKS